MEKKEYFKEDLLMDNHILNSMAMPKIYKKRGLIMEQQMHKKFYCKVCGTEKMFCNHTDYPNKWICSGSSGCHFTTSNPITEPKIPPPKKFGMDSFWDKMAAKSRGEKPISIKSR